MNNIICQKNDGKSKDDDFFSLFADLPPTDPFEDKKESVGVDLIALLVSSGHKRSDLADKLGWSKSRISNVFSGKNNLTLKTVWEVSKAVGYEFDVTFRQADKPRAIQPWEIQHENLVSRNEHVSFVLQLTLQSRSDVFSDVINGRGADAYIRIDSMQDDDLHLRTIYASPISQQTPPLEIEATLQSQPLFMSLMNVPVNNGEYQR
jgi:transcriptional regulator with XRE-family HTH domain